MKLKDNENDNDNDNSNLIVKIDPYIKLTRHQKKGLESLGMIISKDIFEEFDVFVCLKIDEPIQFDFVKAINLGATITSSNWVLDCIEQNDCLHPEEYFLKNEDLKNIEKKYHFSLLDSIEKSRNSKEKLLKEYAFFAVGFSSYEVKEINALVTSCGGKFYDKKTKPINMLTEKHFFVVSNENLKKKEINLCQEKKEEGWKIIKYDELVLSMVKHEIVF